MIKAQWLHSAQTHTFFPVSPVNVWRAPAIQATFQEADATDK
jgi:hypothetical protein